MNNLKKNSSTVSNKKPSKLKVIKLANKIKKGKISKEDKELLEKQILVNKDMLGAVKEALQTVGKGIDHAGAEGKLLLEIINRCVDIINEISKAGNNSDELARELSDKILRIAEILRDINKENKKFWFKTTSMILSFITIIVIVVTGSATASDS